MSATEEEFRENRAEAQKILDEIKAKGADKNIRKLPPNLSYNFEKLKQQVKRKSDRLKRKQD